ARERDRPAHSLLRFKGAELADDFFERDLVRQIGRPSMPAARDASEPWSVSSLALLALVACHAPPGDRCGRSLEGSDARYRVSSRLPGLIQLGRSALAAMQAARTRLDVSCRAQPRTLFAPRSEVLAILHKPKAEAALDAEVSLRDARVERRRRFHDL